MSIFRDLRNHLGDFGIRKSYDEERRLWRGLLKDDLDKGLEKKKSIDSLERFDIFMGRGFFNCYSALGAYVSFSTGAIFGLPLVILGEGFRIIYNLEMKQDFNFRTLMSKSYIKENLSGQRWVRDFWKDVNWEDHNS